MQDIYFGQGTEELFVKVFAAPLKKKRLLWELRSGNIDDFLFTPEKYLDMRFGEFIRARSDWDVYRYLINMGAPDNCYYFSTDKERGRAIIPLIDALCKEEYNSFTSLLICDPCHLLY